MKRRYSTRFNNIPNDFDATAPPVPSVPSLPNQYASSRDQGRGPAQGKWPSLAVDTKAFRDPNLRADQYLQGILIDASEQEVERYQQELQRYQVRASTDLQQNVYQNRTQFIKISKEAERLKGEMRALRNLMSDLKTNTTALRSASQENSENFGDSSFPTTLSKKDRRSSVADRTAMWNSQLQVSLVYGL